MQFKFCIISVMHSFEFFFESPETYANIINKFIYVQETKYIFFLF